MDDPECILLADDRAGFPNTRLPLLVYRRALPASAGSMEAAFARHGWLNAWRNGIFDYHHFHSNAHEALGIARGRVQICFGGPAGRALLVEPGDVLVIPAGVGHCNQGQSDDLLVVGAYPGGADYDIRRGDPAERQEALENIRRVLLPEQDPVGGPDGAVRRIWGPPGSRRHET